jgi:hypothetical protein
LIKGGGVKLDVRPVEHEEISAEGLSGKVLQVGKRRFIRFR